MTEDSQEKSFAQLIEDSEFSVGRELKVGDRIQGRIIAVGKDQAYVDTGTKIDGVVDKQDLVDEEGRFPYAEGDELELFVLSRRHNEIRLGRTMGAAEGGLEQLEQAMHSRIPVQGKVQQTCKGGFRVRVMGQSAFCPLSQIDIRPVDESEDLVGAVYDFLITRVEERGRNIVVSRRALQEKERDESLSRLQETVSTGDILSGTVTRLAPFGAFVRIAPGLEGLVHISEMSWSRNIAPEEVTAPGENVQVKFLGMEEQNKGQPRLQLSMKQAQTDPWEDAAPHFQAGSVVSGTVSRTAPFGVFVEIAPGIEGLVHISEMSYFKRVHKPEDEVSPGQTIPVKIKDIDLQSRRISLSMRDAEGDPWEGIGQRYAPGQVVQGTVEKEEQFGLFVKLEAGVIGLLPRSKLRQEAGTAPEVQWDKLKAGDGVPVRIESIDPDSRRITLAPADASQAEDWKAHAPSEDGPEMGILGQKLQQALRAKRKD
ncbi:30S ribosomal protein S1 [Desulfovermiculus halophilus]|jgi:small subunit ribosomal protein S1|uniref:30S ribosomal protein S1 n=1 Tax=Desulfovermiculus halophilus TaxID=339722 RepID=UPI00048917F3|nr:30S ribosomal protein S1 [Desulfovermiculus halophilus]